MPSSQSPLAIRCSGSRGGAHRYGPANRVGTAVSSAYPRRSEGRFRSACPRGARFSPTAGHTSARAAEELGLENAVVSTDKPIILIGSRSSSLS